MNSNKLTNYGIAITLRDQASYRDRAILPPDSLAALARTHTSFQRDAEQALHRILSIPIRKEIPLTCLEKLASNSEKATFVRSLTIEPLPDHPNENRRVTTCPTNGLVNMHTLSLIFA